MEPSAAMPPFQVVPGRDVDTNLSLVVPLGWL
jgi:hypothetical protein